MTNQGLNPPSDEWNRVGPGFPLTAAPAAGTPGSWPWLSHYEERSSPLAPSSP